jgi:hypothetical protein
VITAAMPAASAIQTMASRSFLFIETSHESSPVRLPDPAGTSVTRITFRTFYLLNHRIGFCPNDRPKSVHMSRREQEVVGMVAWVLLSCPLAIVPNRQCHSRFLDMPSNNHTSCSLNIRTGLQRERECDG